MVMKIASFIVFPPNMTCSTGKIKIFFTISGITRGFKLDKILVK